MHAYFKVYLGREIPIAQIIKYETKLVIGRTHALSTPPHSSHKHKLTHRLSPFGKSNLLEHNARVRVLDSGREENMTRRRLVSYRRTDTMIVWIVCEATWGDACNYIK